MGIPSHSRPERRSASFWKTRRRIDRLPNANEIAHYVTLETITPLSDHPLVKLPGVAT
jgi:hypothetical protein